MRKKLKIFYIIGLGFLLTPVFVLAAANPLIPCNSTKDSTPNGLYVWCKMVGGTCKSGPVDNVPMDTPFKQNPDTAPLNLCINTFKADTFVGCTDGQATPDLCVSAAAARAGGGIGCCMVKYAGNRKCTEVNGSNEKDICIAASTATTLATFLPNASVFGVADFSNALGVEYADKTACATIPECPQYVAAATKQPLFVPDWTGPDCVKAGGEWLPDAGKTSGQFCFAKQNIDYTPQISIGGGKIANLGDYVAKAYNYALGFVLMIAIIMVMIGGVQYIMARGGGGVGEAKKRIGNAVLGVILLFCAYLILNTVSPALVKLSLPRVPMLKQNKFAFSEVANCGGYKEQKTCEQNAVGMNKGWDCMKPQGTTSAGCKWDVASKSCSMAPSAQAGALYSQCPDGKCNEGLFCATVLFTGNCKLCSDGKRGSPCNSGSDCKDPDAATCDNDIKQCMGETMRPIGAKCDDDKQCANGSCYKAHCGAAKIGLACTGEQYRPQDTYPSWMVTVENWMKFTAKTEADAKADLQACRRPSYDGETCFLSVTCQSGKCNNDNPNRNAQKLGDLLQGKCVAGSSKPSGSPCGDNDECASGVCNPTGPASGACK